MIGSFRQWNPSGETPIADESWFDGI